MEIIQYAKNMPARWIFLIFDACYTGTTFRHDIPTGARDDQVLKALVAGTEDQPVLDGGAGEHSVFTRAILDGLDGWADSGQRPDDVISADELIVYVESEVPWRSRLRGHEQTPTGGPLQGTRLARDFELRPVRPRLPAPLLRNIYSPNEEDRIAAATQLGVMAATDPAQVLEKKAAELIRLVEEDSVLSVRVTAVRALGTLRLPAGCATLVKLLEADRAESELCAAAAAALGDLAQMAPCREESIRALIGALRSEDPIVLEAVKLALGHNPESALQLTHALDSADRQMKGELVDTLACLAVVNPQDERAWPALHSIDARLLRRGLLANRRLRHRWRDIRWRILSVGLSGALGLSLGYVILILGLKPVNPYVPAVFSYNLLPGGLAGVSLVLVPQLIRAVARRPGRKVAFLGAAVGGLLLGLGLILPNWFLRIGSDWVAWLVPAQVSGLAVSLTMAAFPMPPASLDSRERVLLHSGAARRFGVPLVATALAGGLSFALLRLPEALAWGGEPRWAVLLRFAIGGAAFAVALALGSSLSPAEISQHQEV